MRTCLFGILVVTIAAALLAGCGESGTGGGIAPTPEPKRPAKTAAMSEPAAAGIAKDSTWGEELVYLRPVEASIPWREWTIFLNDWGNIQERRICRNRYDELIVLEQIARRNPKPANPWAAVFSLSTATDMVRVDLDGTRLLESAGMSLNQKRYAEEAYETYMRQAYAYSRGNLRIVNIRRDPLEPFTGEYRGAIFFWPGGDYDIGRDLEPMSFDSMNAIWFPGPVRPWSRGATSGGRNWGYFAGHTSTQFAPGREAGRQISDVAHITLHEWLHQIAGMRWHLGYFGLPGQYCPGNYNAGAHLYYQHYIITPRMWRTMHHREPQKSAPNKPKNRHAGYILDWLICGEFEGADREAIPDDPVHRAWTSIQVLGRALTKEELRFPEGEAHLLPDEGDELMGKRWLRHKPARDLYTLGVYDGELDMVHLRRDGNQGAFPVKRTNVFIYAHTYVWSPEAQDAIIWATSAEPFQLYLNAEECFRIGRGTAQDEAVRNVRLRKGWNRVLIQKMDQAERNWSFSVKFTDRDRNDLPGLKVSAAKPKLLDEPAILRVDKDAPCVEPIVLPLKYYSWTGEVADDWWGALPILNEQHFEALLGRKSVRIDGGRDLERPVPGPDHSGHDKTLFVDVTGIRGIVSRIAPERDSYDYLLNNLMNQAIETTALIRYTHPTSGKPRDLLLVRIDMVEPFIELVEVADPRPLKESIIGTIVRDTKQAVVFETYLGERLPANEVDLVSVQGEEITLRAWPSVPRVVRGEPLMLNVEAAYLKGRDEGVPDLENIRLKLVQQLPTETADTAGYRDERTESLPSLKPGESVTIEAAIDTKALASGIATYIGSVAYVKNGETHTTTRPVPVHVFDPVDVTLSIDGSSLLTKPHAIASVVVHSNLSKRARGAVRLTLPDGWKASPAKHTFKLNEQDDETRLSFKLTLPPDAASTTYILRAIAEVGAAKGVISKGAHQVQVALGDALIYEDFEHGIPSDFGHTSGLYKVQLAREDDGTPVAFKGSTCLRVQDSGGARYGHVRMFGADRFWPAGRRKPHTTYTYDTNDYPIIEWWMRSDGRDANLGLNVALETDRRQKRYGVLLHGLWEQQWDFSRKIGAVDFPTDGRWHKITINLDELLDNYLGNEAHLVREVTFGDTRIFASGWWSDAHNYTHYLDDFTIRKAARPDELHEQAKDVLLLKGDDRPPAFELRGPTDGLLLTIRPREVSYTQDDDLLLDGWYSNMGQASLSAPSYPAIGSIAIKLVNENDKDLFDDREGGWLILSPLMLLKSESDKSGLDELITLNRGESARWTREHDGAVRLNKLIEGYLEERGLEPLVPAGRYNLTAKVVQVFSSETESNAPAWEGEAVSNTIVLVIEPSPTKEELLEQLKSPYERERAQAVTALYSAKHFDTLPAIVKTLEDPDATVRLNAAYAIGEVAREHYRPAVARVKHTVRDAEPRDEAARELAVLKATWDPVVTALIKALDDENWRVGEYAGFALAKIGDPRGIEPLTRRLENTSPWIRRRTAEALGDYWLHMPADSDDARGRQAAAKAAALAFEKLLAVTDDEMISTRLFAYRAARRFVGRPEWAGADEAVPRIKFEPAIRKAFGDGSWNIRADGARWAAEWPQADFSTELAAQVKARDWIAREQLAASLGRLANSRADIAVHKAREAARAEGQELTDEQANAIALEAKQPQIELLKQLLEDERIQVRWAAVKALHDLKTGKTIEELTGHDAHYWRALTN